MTQNSAEQKVNSCLLRLAYIVPQMTQISAEWKIFHSKHCYP